MATKRVLITGGAGFIGSHLADELLARGYRVRALDSLVPEVHGKDRRRPGYLATDVELIEGDIRDRRAVDRALKSVDVVFHLAAGVDVARTLGTAVLLDALSEQPVEKLIIASSKNLYGEGAYCTAEGEVVEVRERSLHQLKAGEWDPTRPGGEPLEPAPTPETRTPTLGSDRALEQHDQERICLLIGQARGTPTVALRFFNVYGPRESLIKPDAGAVAVFASRLLQGNPPLILEDGLQQRDFVSVHDVARACRLALESTVATGRAFNVGSGTSMTIRTVAAQMAEALGRRQLRPEITGKFRIGDVRHCIADTTLAAKALGYEARVSFTEGLLELSEWVAGQRVEDRIAEMGAQLDAPGLSA